MSASRTYNSRLEKQSIRQQELASFGIRVPAVLCHGYREELFYFDMDYVPGIVADQAMLGDKKGLDRLAAFYSQTVETFGRSVTGTLPATLFEEKIISVLATRSPLLAERHTAWRLARAGDWLADADWCGIPKSSCHGDLTLENTIISKSGDISLIDCLDGPLTTFWLDLAKLYQDFTAHWFLREQPEMVINTSQRGYALLAAAHLGEAIRRRLEPTMPAPFAKLNQLLALQLFRVVPYCQCAPVLHYNLSRLETLMDAELNQ